MTSVLFALLGLGVALGCKFFKNVNGETSYLIGMVVGLLLASIAVTIVY